MKKIISLIVLLLVAGIAHAETIDKIVATVDGKAITVSELDNAMKTLGPALQKDSKASGTALRAKVLDKLIDNMALENAMEKSDIKITQAEVDSQMDTLIQRSGLSKEAFVNEIIKRGSSLETFRKDMELQMRRSRYIEMKVGKKVSISEIELKDYFDKHMNEFKSLSSVHLAQISMPFAPTTTEDDFKAMMKQAEQILAAAKGSSNFDALAKTYDGKPYRVAGGDLGVVNVADLQPNIVQAIQTLDKGQAGGPIVTGTGINIVKVIDRAQTSAKDFATVRDQVYNIIYEQKMREVMEGYVKQLRKTAKIDIKGL